VAIEEDSEEDEEPKIEDVTEDRKSKDEKNSENDI